MPQWLLSGFRAPGVLVSHKQLQAKLPLDVQAVLAAVGEAAAELLADLACGLSAAFVPAVSASS